MSEPLAARPEPSRLANAIRFLTIDAVDAAQSGHPGMVMGMADVATVLFTRIMRFDAGAPKWPDRDRFILSAGHGSMLLYAVLYLTGYQDISLQDIKDFRKTGAKTAGHPEYGRLAGIEATTGPLGQGFATSVGMALGERIMAERFGEDLNNHYTYVMAGDGCLMEGISQEALTMAAHLGLGKLIVLFDDNNVTIDGTIDHASSENQITRFQAAGWDVSAVDGHNHDAVEQAILAAQKTDKPSLIACKTVIGFGSRLKAGKPAAHFGALTPEDAAHMHEDLNWPQGPFEVPDDVLHAWREAGQRGAADRQAWETCAADAPAEFTRRIAGDLPENWHDLIAAIKAEVLKDPAPVATRMATGAVLNGLFHAMPELVGGSADLAGSTLTFAKDAAVITAQNYGGRYMAYGIREHAMAAVMNGLALHGGFIPFGGTFLCFIDYARPALRLSALMGLRAIYVMTHDSFLVGEDGPTHQPVEHLAGLRAMPNVNVFRPADMIEAIECWELALSTSATPSVLCLSRGPLPVNRRDATRENKCARGGYILRDADGEARVTLVATGSEVRIALEARDRLQGEGIPTAVVSLPCWEMFDAQDRCYRDDVLRPDTTVQVAIEAQSPIGWERYVGRDGAIIGMTSFGESGPDVELLDHFGFTADAVVRAAKERMN